MNDVRRIVPAALDEARRFFATGDQPYDVQGRVLLAEIDRLRARADTDLVHAWAGRIDIVTAQRDAALTDIERLRAALNDIQTAGDPWSKQRAAKALVGAE
jgi:hypothetical protein